MKALIIIDVQNDFCPEGQLAVSGGNEVVPIINQLMKKFDKVIATQDWHPADHTSFSSNNSGTVPMDMIDLNGIMQVMWPDHCVQGTTGAEFHSDLNVNPIDLILRKGTNRNLDSYSAFLENDQQTETGLTHYLKGLGIKDLYFAGLATDYCVYFSAMDAKDAGFNASVIIDACRGVDFPENNVNRTIEIMKVSGVRIIESKEL